MFEATSGDYIKSSSQSDGYWAARAPPAGPKQNTGAVPGGEASTATPRGWGVLTKARRTPGSVFPYCSDFKSRISTVTSNLSCPTYTNFVISRDGKTASLEYIKLHTLNIYRFLFIDQTSIKQFLLLKVPDTLYTLGNEKTVFLYTPIQTH